MIVTLMTGLTILFVVYILYIVFTTLKTGCGDQPASSLTDTKPVPVTRVDIQEGESRKQPAPSEGGSTPEEIAQVKQFRHPDSGETAAVPTNYRFAKRWIKEAMVKEGLLDRIYKNNELQDEDVNLMVKQALEKFKGLKKYWG